MCNSPFFAFGGVLEISKVRDILNISFLKMQLWPIAYNLIGFSSIRRTALWVCRMNNSGNSTRKTKWNYRCHMRILTVYAPHRWTYTEEFACVNFQFDKILCRCRSPPVFPSKKKWWAYRNDKKERWHIQRWYMPKPIYCLCGFGSKTKAPILHRYNHTCLPV